MQSEEIKAPQTQKRGRSPSSSIFDSQARDVYDASTCRAKDTMGHIHESFENEKGHGQNKTPRKSMEGKASLDFRFSGRDARLDGPTIVHHNICARVGGLNYVVTSSHEREEEEDDRACLCPSVYGRRKGKKSHGNGPAAR